MSCVYSEECLGICLCKNFFMTNPFARPPKIQIISPIPSLGKSYPFPLIKGLINNSININIRTPKLKPSDIQLYPGVVKSRGFENLFFWISSHFFFNLFLNQTQIGKVTVRRIKLVTFLKQGMILPQLSQYKPNQFLKAVLL